MIRGEQLRHMLDNGGQRDHGRFIRHVYEGLGLADANGNRYLTPAGNPDWAKVQEARSKGGYLPNEFSLLEAAHAVLGENWHRKMVTAMGQPALLQASHQLLEAGTGAVTPSDFIDVNALTAVVTGLYEVSVLEGYNRPDLAFVDRLAPADPTKVFGGKKVIGAAPISANGEIRKPGMPTARANFGERWIVTPPTDERALSIEVLYEAFYLDLTGDVNSQANDIGYRIRRRQATRCIDCFIGVTSATQYNYKGNTYNTYLSNGYYDNDFSNELIHETNVEAALIKFRDMTDPETGERVVITPNLMVVNRGKLRTAKAILGETAESTQYRDTGSAPQIRQSAPAYKGQFEILESPLIFERCIAADGLNLSTTNAEKYWWMADTQSSGGHIRYSQNWPLRTQTATPTQMDMIDRGVALFIKVDERGEPYVRQARNAVRCKN